MTAPDVRFRIFDRFPDISVQFNSLKAKDGTLCRDHRAILAGFIPEATWTFDIILELFFRSNNDAK